MKYHGGVNGQNTIHLYISQNIMLYNQLLERYHRLTERFTAFFYRILISKNDRMTKKHCLNLLVYKVSV